MISRNVLSTIINTSDFAVMSATLQIATKYLARETKTAMVLAMESARLRFDRELRICDVQSASIPKHISPMEVTETVENEEYEKLTSFMERGWDGERIYGEGFAMANVGFIRCAEGYNAMPEELFNAMDAIQAAVTAIEENPEDPEIPEAIKGINYIALAMASPAGEMRDTMYSMAMNLATPD